MPVCGPAEEGLSDPPLLPPPGPGSPREPLPPLLFPDWFPDWFPEPEPPELPPEPFPELLPEEPFPEEFPVSEAPVKTHVSLRRPMLEAPPKKTA